MGFMLGLVCGATAGLLLARRWRRRRRAEVEGPGIADVTGEQLLAEQDTQPVAGEAALHPPPGSELVQQGRLQG